MALNESDQPWAEEKLLSALHDRREEVQLRPLRVSGTSPEFIAASKIQ